MSESKDTLINVMILLCLVVPFIVCPLAEAFWISKKGWAGFGKSLGFSVVTDLIGYTIGFFVVFGAFFLVLISANNGWIPKESTTVGWTIIALGGLSFPVLLIVCKRLFISFFQMKNVKSAWLFSLIVSLISVFVSLPGPIFSIYYFL